MTFSREKFDLLSSLAWYVSLCLRFPVTLEAFPDVRILLKEVHVHI